LLNLSCAEFRLSQRGLLSLQDKSRY
jgi:hypothetical protein